MKKEKITKCCNSKVKIVFTGAGIYRYECSRCHLVIGKNKNYDQTKPKN